ncbi:hypothetical protein SO802_021467 [Lithocarpus litseifolius]|uniref:Replication factor A C-terminal domain-containing protein n=1 Tax=Lithocarpus litseifolius TaxID=425828 RepID=A0AAW2CEZ9_9ROSI
MVVESGFVVGDETGFGCGFHVLQSHAGEYNLSLTSGTRVYIDLEIPETAEFKDQYRIQLKVEDSSGMATFILFDSEAETLLNISAKDLLNKSLEYGWEIYTVKKLFDSFEGTNKAIQLDKMTEAYISDTSNECSNNLSTEDDGDCTKFHKLDDQSNVQLTPTSVLKENKTAYSRTTTKQQRKKIQKRL